MFIQGEGIEVFGFVKVLELRYFLYRYIKLRFFKSNIYFQMQGKLEKFIQEDKGIYFSLGFG